MGQEITRILDKLLSRTLQLADLDTLCDLVSGKSPLMPLSGETAAIAPKMEKTVALCFDRVWGPADSSVPNPVRFFARSERERAFLLYLLLMGIISDNDKLSTTDQQHLDAAASVFFHRHLFPYVEPDLIPRNSWARALSRMFRGDYNIAAVAVYKHNADFNRQYPMGKHEIIVAAISELAVVDEEALSWDQVMQFRSDTEARLKYRRLLHWFDSDMIGKDKSYVIDTIALKLHDYENALKKHGIRTALGTLEEVIDGKYLLGASGLATAFSMAGHPNLGVLAAGALAVCKVTISFAQKLIDLDDVESGPHSEIAYIHQLKSRL